MTYTRAKIYQFLKTDFSDGALFDVSGIYKALYVAQKHVPMSTIQHALQEFEKDKLIARVNDPGKKAQFTLAKESRGEASASRETFRRRATARRLNEYRSPG